MKCKVCKRVLKDPESIRMGIGPVCRRGFRGIPSLVSRENLEDFIITDYAGVVLERRPGKVATNVLHLCDFHGRGFEWGYGGSGPADLALNILLQFGVPKDEAFRFHQRFKWQFIASAPREGTKIPAHTIEAWLEAQTYQMELFDGTHVAG